jgi:hypothetical protein
MTNMGTPMTDPDGLLAEFEARLAETTRKAEQVHAGLAATNATAGSADGRIAVTVNASGNVVDLRLPDAELAAAILDTIRRAQSRLADAARKAMPAELSDTDLVSELDTQYRKAYPEPPAPPRPRQKLRFGAEEDRAAASGPSRRQRPKPGGDDTEYGDRTLLR